MAGNKKARLQKGLSIALGGSLFVGIASAVAFAQDSETGTEYRFGISTGLRHDSNSNLSRTTPERNTDITTALSFGVTRETRRSALDLSLKGDATYRDSNLAPSGFDFENPEAALSFEHELSATRVSFDAAYSESDVDRFVSLLDPFSGEIVTDTVEGKRRAFSTELGLHLNEDQPLEAKFTLSRSGVRYVDTQSTSLDDVDQWRFGADIEAEINPLLTLHADVSRTDREERDTRTVTRVTDSVSIGADYDITAITTLTARIGYSQIDQSGSANLSDQSGSTYKLGLTREVPLGTVGVSLDHRVVENGTREKLAVSTDLEWQRQALSGEFGISRQPNDDTDWVAQLSYAYEMPRSQISLSGLREVRVDSDGFDEVTTQIRAGWDHQINTISGLSVVADISAVDFSDPTTLDAQRQVLTTSYNRALTEDWQLTGGVRFTVDRRDTLDDVTSNAVFVTLDREFSFRN